jgi:2-oxoglutarate dehydrogenase E2 component (dihydrolipoamide succinyltransferase)
VARIDVIMPQMGESIAEGTVSRWLKQVGDEVKRDEAIFEISTDKVDAEIPSPAAGVLAEILVGEGQTVAVNTVVAKLETEKGAAVASPGGAPSVTREVPSVAPPGAATAQAGAPSVTREVPSGGTADAAAHSPSATREVPSEAPPGAAPAPPGATTVPPGAATAPRPAAGSFEDRLRTRSSPLVRRLAAEHGVDLAGLSGSGIAGRVTKRDFEAFLANGGAATRAVPSEGASWATEEATARVAVPGRPAVGDPVFAPWPGDTVEPMTKMRKATAAHMRQARQLAAHVTSFFEIDLTRVARIRAQHRDAFEASAGVKLTYLPFILRAVTQMLLRHPVMNATVSGDDVILRRQYNLGIAVALEPTGLLVPVIKRADDLSLAGLARAANDLALRARSRKLQPAELQDATFTITNPGVFGSLIGTPIIPVGTTAILGLGAIEKRPKVVAGPDGEDVIAIRTCAYFSISFDHRVVDGADADRFMADLKRTLESVPEGV